MGRRPIGTTAMTTAERQRRRRARAKALRVSQPAPPPDAARTAPDVLALDAEAIAAWIANGVSAEKAGVIAASLQRRLWQGRPRPG